MRTSIAALALLFLGLVSLSPARAQDPPAGEQIIKKTTTTTTTTTNPAVRRTAKVVRHTRRRHPVRRHYTRRARTTNGVQIRTVIRRTPGTRVRISVP